MRRMLTTMLCVALLAPALPARAQSGGGASLGSITLNRTVMADGKKLDAGTYQVRLTDEKPKPAVGQSPDGERYVEFVRDGRVVGREVASVIPNTEVAGIDKWSAPKDSAPRVQLLRGDDYVRVWFNRDGHHYLINLPTGVS